MTITLRSIFDDTIQDLWRGRGGESSYRSISSWWVTTLGDVVGESITPAQVLQALSTPGISGRPLSSATRRKYLAHLKTALRHSLGPGAPSLPSLPPGPRKTRVLGAEELERLLGAFDCPRSRDLARFLSATGARLGEALAVGPESGVQASEVRFRNTKSGRDRVVPFSPRARHAFRGGWRRLTETTFRRAWRGAVERAGLPGVTPHTLRHTAITRMVRAGVPLPVVQEIAGHSDIQTTLRYTHVDSDDLARAVAALA